MISKDEYLQLYETKRKHYTKYIFNDIETKSIIQEWNTKYNLCPINNANAIYNYYFNITTPLLCVCGKSLTFGGNKRFGYTKFCSSKCMANDDTIKTTRVEKFLEYSKTFNKKEYLDSIEESLVTNSELSVIPDIKDRLLEYINTIPIANIRYHLLHHDLPLAKSIKTIYGELSSEAFYKIMFPLERNTCLCCGNSVQFSSYQNGYNKYCSLVCYGKNIGKDRRNNKIITNDDNFYNLESTINKLLEYSNIIESKKYKRGNFSSSIIKRDMILYKSIVHHTIFLNKKCKMKERVHCILNNITSPVKCSCGKVLVFNNTKNSYSTMCKRCLVTENSEKSRQTLILTLRPPSYINNKTKIEESGDYKVLSTMEDYVDTGIMKIYHNVCGKIMERDVAFSNGCFHCVNSGVSNPEREVRTFIEKYKDIEFNKRKMMDNKYELDIFVPEHNLGIEYNGLYWHSEGRVGKRYHKDKLDYARSKNINLIQIFANEWLTKKDIVKSILLSKMGIYSTRFYARKCIVREVDYTASSLFLNDNHIQGKISGSLYVGLYYNDELVSIMCFGKRKITKGNLQFELLRYCSKLNTQVVGGASKLFKYASRYFNECLSYADLRYSNGELYNALGFTLDHISKPNYLYFHNRDETIVYHRSNFMKHKLKGMNGYDSNKTEYEIMKENGYLRVWDCGNMVFKWKK